MTQRRKRLRVALTLAAAACIGGVLVLYRSGSALDPGDVEFALSALQEQAADATMRWLGVQPESGDLGILLYVQPEADGPWVWKHAEGETPEHIVLLIHGLDEPGQVFDDLAPALVQAGYAVARFEYPNDQSPALSADLLGESLGALRASGTRRIEIIGHSMGGLVARDALTREGIYGGLAGGHDDLPNVDRLIMVGTPNHGSPWARLRAIGEIREHLVRFRQSDSYDPRQLLAFLSDGLGDAGSDLLPGSAYLAELNARPLPRGVRLTTVVGEIATVEGPELSWVRESRVLRALLGKAHMAALLDSIDELMTELGDGVVTARSARLEGVEDAPLVTGSHRGMLFRIEAEARVRAALTGSAEDQPPAIGIILDRLSRTPKDP